MQATGLRGLPQVALLQMNLRNSFMVPAGYKEECCDDVRGASHVHIECKMARQLTDPRSRWQCWLVRSFFHLHFGFLSV